MLKTEGMLINPAFIESARFSKDPVNGTPKLTLIHAKEGQRDYQGPEAKELWDTLNERNSTLPDVLAELAEIREQLNEGLKIVKGFIATLAPKPPAQQS